MTAFEHSVLAVSRRPRSYGGVPARTGASVPARMGAPVGRVKGDRGQQGRVTAAQPGFPSPGKNSDLRVELITNTA